MRKPQVFQISATTPSRAPGCEPLSGRVSWWRWQCPEDFRTTSASAVVGMDMPRLQWPSTRRRRHLDPAGDGVLARFAVIWKMVAYEKTKVNGFNPNIGIPNSRISNHQPLMKVSLRPVVSTGWSSQWDVFFQQNNSVWLVSVDSTKAFCFF